MATALEWKVPVRTGISSSWTVTAGSVDKGWERQSQEMSVESTAAPLWPQISREPLASMWKGTIQLHTHHICAGSAIMPCKSPVLPRVRGRQALAQWPYSIGRLIMSHARYDLLIELQCKDLIVLVYSAVLHVPQSLNIYFLGLCTFWGVSKRGTTL